MRKKRVAIPSQRKRKHSNSGSRKRKPWLRRVFSLSYCVHELYIARSCDSRGGVSHRKSCAGHFCFWSRLDWWAGLGDASSREPCVVGFDCGHSPCASDTHASPHDHYARAFFFRLERTSLLGDGMDRARIRRRRLCACAPRCARPLHNLVVDSEGSAVVTLTSA